jgi:hypothetical protein
MPTKRNQNLFFLLLVVTWTLLVLAGYYYYHKPLTIESLPAPLTGLLDVLLAVLLLGLFGGLGRFEWRALRLPPLDTLAPLERATLQVVLGAGSTSLLWLALGALHLYSAVAGVGAAAGRLAGLACAKTSPG